MLLVSVAFYLDMSRYKSFAGFVSAEQVGGMLVGRLSARFEAYSCSSYQDSLGSAELKDYYNPY